MNHIFCSIIIAMHYSNYPSPINFLYEYVRYNTTKKYVYSCFVYFGIFSSTTIIGNELSHQFCVFDSIIIKKNREFSLRKTFYLICATVEIFCVNCIIANKLGIKLESVLFKLSRRLSALHY